ncbi:hypothetical protein RKLH11_3554 [Rhodobacteraceae bacterium KLH11]|nr:hypothetical protein RKLH11_3554 [Rhodobacteraceae bacterium KLH11]
MYHGLFSKLAMVLYLAFQTPTEKALLIWFSIFAFQQTIPPM